MRHRIISISKAKANLLKLARKVEEEGEAYLLTKDGEPIGALVPMEDYEAMLETTDVLANSETTRNLKAALEDERKGRLWRRDRSGRWTKVKRPGRAA